MDQKCIVLIIHGCCSGRCDDPRQQAASGVGAAERLTVAFDAGWQRLGSGRQYNSLTGMLNFRNAEQ